MGTVTEEKGRGYSLQVGRKGIEAADCDGGKASEGRCGGTKKRNIYSTNFRVLHVFFYLINYPFHKKK